ncbi:MAG: histidinol-phosphatase [Clostridia bacterium]|nr:histidinol-phosphatase [Clostridia bacterium]
MGYTDLHTHTNFCDGKDSPEDMVISAIEKGIDTLGILTHSYVEFDLSACIREERQTEFIAEIARLKEKYKGKINLLCGLEVDYYTTSQIEGYDYKLGSLHYFKIGEKYYSLDISIPGFIEMVEKEFGGDYLAVCEEYYRLLADVVRKTNADIIAHIDLITKFNEGNKLFDTGDPRYVRAYRRAVDELIKTGKPFEINTGAISRGYRTTPYPAPDILDYIKSKGGKLIISSDSHSKENIAYLFDKYADLAN